MPTRSPPMRPSVAAESRRAAADSGGRARAAGARRAAVDRSAEGPLPSATGLLRGNASETFQPSGGGTVRILMIHAAEFSFHVTQETSVAAAAGDVAEADKSGSSGDSLVCFVSVEKKDGDAPERVVAEAVRKILEHHRRVDAETLWLYPYAHLSSDLASPRMARRILDLMWEAFNAAKAARKLARAPFGYYKAFHIEAKGHPLS